MSKLILSWGRLICVAVVLLPITGLQFVAQEKILASAAQKETTCTLADYAAGENNDIIAHVNCADGPGTVFENTTIVRLMKSTEPTSCLRYKDNVIRCSEQK